MALRRIDLEYINGCIFETLGELSGKHMLELGNQYIIEDSIPEKIGKKYFNNRGVNHVSVDLNGLDDALKLDLSKPEQFLIWHSYFDIVTNSGTSEHVEPKSGQYNCFLIIHNCLKVGGVAIHLIPDANELKDKMCWKGHCNNYYSCDFVRMLAKNNNYKLISLKIMDGLVCFCLQKTEDAPFMENRREFLKHITRRSGGAIYPGINDRGIYGVKSFLGKIKRKLIQKPMNAG
ncbi:MAG: hypothetical protein ABH843_08000 [Candidatus Omnitrophota bacterium]